MTAPRRRAQINFGVGQPSADLLPMDLHREASEAFFSEAVPLELNYGERQGDARFLEILAAFLEPHYGSPVDRESLFLTGGNSQALDLACSVFARAGDTVFVEEPSYFLAFQIIRDRGCRIRGIPVDEHGLRVDALEDALQEDKPALLYTIPSYHNPGGQCLSLERRQRVADLSREYGFVVAAGRGLPVAQLRWPGAARHGNDVRTRPYPVDGFILQDSRSRITAGLDSGQL